MSVFCPIAMEDIQEHREHAIGDQEQKPLDMPKAHHYEVLSL